jgi:ubiquinone/menaquinone biosynthesis C-methylase UbiE
VKPAKPTARIGPQAYDAWRASALGRITERLEERLIVALLGALPGRRLLDVGCGDGRLLALAAGEGAAAFGLDPDPAMLEAARQRARRAGIEASFLAGRIEALPFADRSFDIVAAVTVLCFVADAPGALKEIARVLRPGGRLVLGELARGSLWAAIRRLRGAFGSPLWRAAHFRSAAELAALAGAAGLEVVSQKGAVHYPPFALCARLFAPLEPALEGLLFGAAFVALAAQASAPHEGE